MWANQQYFPGVEFIVLYKMVLTFVSLEGILKSDHLNESYSSVLSYGAVYYTVQSGSNY